MKFCFKYFPIFLQNYTFARYRSLIDFPEQFCCDQFLDIKVCLLTKHVTMSILSTCITCSRLFVPRCLCCPNGIRNWRHFSCSCGYLSFIEMSILIFVFIAIFFMLSSELKFQFFLQQTN